jgi:hypothetical protein
VKLELNPRRRLGRGTQITRQGPGSQQPIERGRPRRPGIDRRIPAPAQIPPGNRTLELPQPDAEKIPHLQPTPRARPPARFARGRRGKEQHPVREAPPGNSGRDSCETDLPRSARADRIGGPPAPGRGAGRGGRQLGLGFGGKMGSSGTRAGEERANTSRQAEGSSLALSLVSRRAKMGSDPWSWPQLHRMELGSKC